MIFRICRILMIFAIFMISKIFMIFTFSSFSGLGRGEGGCISLFMVFLFRRNLSAISGLGRNGGANTRQLRRFELLPSVTAYQVLLVIVHSKQQIIGS